MLLGSPRSKRLDGGLHVSYDSMPGRHWVLSRRSPRAWAGAPRAFIGAAKQNRFAALPTRTSLLLDRPEPSRGRGGSRLGAGACVNFL